MFADDLKPREFASVQGQKHLKTNVIPIPACVCQG